MRIYEKYNIWKLLRFSYSWDMSRNTLLFPASTTLRAGVESGGNTTALDCSSICPTYTDTVIAAILPRNYRFNTVLDGVAFGNVKIYFRITSTDGYVQTLSMTVTARLRTVTAAGVWTTHKTYTIVTGYSISRAMTGETVATLEFPFWFDLDNIHIPVTERLVWELTFSGCRALATEAAAGTAYHTLSTDETFIELPYVP